MHETDTADLVMDLNKLAEQYAKTHDPAVREQIAVACTSLIRGVASEFLSQGVPQEDLIQVGYLGLLAAIEGFDPSRGFRFKTYAVPQIRGRMRHYLRDSRDTIRRPRWLQKTNQQIEQAVGRYVSKNGRFPSVEQLASELNVTEEGLLEILSTREAVRTVPLDASEEDDDPDIRRDLIKHKEYVSFQLPIEDKIVLHEAIEKLTERQRQVLYHLFFRDRSQPETAKTIGVSQKQVSRVLSSALTRLRALLIHR